MDCVSSGHCQFQTIYFERRDSWWRLQTESFNPIRQQAHCWSTECFLFRHDQIVWQQLRTFLFPAADPSSTWGHVQCDSAPLSRAGLSFMLTSCGCDHHHHHHHHHRQRPVILDPSACKFKHGIRSFNFHLPCPTYWCSPIGLLTESLSILSCRASSFDGQLLRMGY
jgi:hypothetical protein